MRFTGKDNLKSGVPLGGIGTGKVEIFPDGLLGRFTYQNNYSTPISNWHNNYAFGETGKFACHGNYFGIFIEKSNKKIAKLLTTVNIGNYPEIDDINYEGEFPRAKLDYIDEDISKVIEIKLEAFGTIIPHNYNDSMIPSACFLFRIRNKTKEKIRVAILAIARNTSGAFIVGRKSEVKFRSNLTMIKFTHNNPLPNDIHAGEFCLATSKIYGRVTFHTGLNLLKEPFINDFKNINLEFWDYFKNNGELKNIKDTFVATGQGVEVGGALAVTSEFKANENKEVMFFYTWHSGHKYETHIYERRFSNAENVAVYISKNAIRIYNEQNREFSRIFRKTKINKWLKDIMLNNLYPLVSSSVWKKDERFSMFEAPVICPLMSTLDVRYYASIPLALLFPKLELSELMQLKKSQNKDGYIPHDLGWNRLDNPSDGTTAPPKWKDLNAQYTLMIYRDYLFTKDKIYIREFYNSMKKAMNWLFTTDKNKDYLPDSEGADQTFDAWGFYGVNSYTSSVYLAALKAAEKIAVIRRDKKIASECREKFEKGKKSFEEKLWNGKYFIACYSQDRSNTASTIAQLNGQWYANMLGLGYIVSSSKVKEAISYLLNTNAKVSKYGAVNSLLISKKFDESSSHSNSIWVGENYAFACLCIQEGFLKEGLKIIKKIWDTIVNHNKDPWNQPDSINPVTGRYTWGDHYMRNMSIWSLLNIEKKNIEKQVLSENIEIKEFAKMISLIFKNVAVKFYEQKLPFKILKL